ncbi:MAG TPA: Bax inhibitor-1/YccA family protein [Ktedonobacterales bacterium]|nr:Bax inhibitor-1/YccA family protein [Ktedonobacterales bacterium]
MNPYTQYQGSGYPAGVGASGIDFGAIMRQVYLWLAGGLAICFGVAYVLGNLAINSPNSAAAALIFNPVAIIVALIAYLGLGFGFYPIVRRASPAVGAALFIIFAVVFGFLISSVFIVYTPASIATAFVTTAAMFGIMSIIGFTTKLDLSKLGALFLTALIGLIIGSVVNIFVHSSILYWVITYLGVIIFTGLIAFDTQWIKKNALSVAGSGDTASVSRVALIGAFRLLLDFVNLFLYLLRIFGGGRN